MATSGSANSGTSLSGSYIRVAWDRTGTGANSSTIRVRLYLELRGGANVVATETGYTRNDANQNFSHGSTARGPNGTYLIDTYTRTLNHDTNGNKTLSWGGQFKSGFASLGTMTVSNRNSAVTRIALAPSNNAPTWSDVGETTATANGSVSNNGHGTSSTITLRYKKSSNDLWTQLDSGTSKNIIEMTSNTEYDLSSQAVNNNGDTSSWSVAVQTVTLPLAAVLGTPVASVTNITVPITQDVGGGAYAITQQYRIRESSGSFGGWINVTGDSFTASDLAPGTKYRVQVQSITSAGTTIGDESADITTLPAPNTNATLLNIIGVL